MSRKSTQPASDVQPAKAECNAPDCPRTPTTRGLCDAHYASLRGLADPKD
ncbi:hypothetical protein GCM10009804_03100 [Kribbella hippodromi]|uniref:Uncharacterized protein n=1 Tax=Kribbella hippodromi TaxID=434347 RepID=A0ABP4MTH6_9ACTN